MACSLFAHGVKPLDAFLFWGDRELSSVAGMRKVFLGKFTRNEVGKKVAVRSQSAQIVCVRKVREASYHEDSDVPARFYMGNSDCKLSDRGS